MNKYVYVKDLYVFIVTLFWISYSYSFVFYLIIVVTNENKR